MWSIIEAVHGTNPKEEVKSLLRGELRGRPGGKEWGGDTVLGEFESKIPHSHNSLKSHRHGTHIFGLRVTYSFQGRYVRFNVAYIKRYVDIGKNGYLTLTQKKTLWFLVQVLQLLLCLHPWLLWKLKCDRVIWCLHVVVTIILVKNMFTRKTHEKVEGHVSLHINKSQWSLIGIISVIRGCMWTRSLVLLMDVNQQYTKTQSWTQPKSNDDGQCDSEIPSTLIWPFIVSLLASLLLHLWCYSTSNTAVIPFPSAQLDIICIYKICPRTQQVPAVAAELLNLFAEVTRKKRWREEKKL